MKNKRFYRDLLKMCSSIMMGWLYLPHLLFMQKYKNTILSDTEVNMSRKDIKVNKWLGTLFLLHTDAFFRKLFYYRIGAMKALLISWLRPGDKYLIFSQTTKIGKGCRLAHPYATILNAEKIGDNFVVRQCTTLGMKDGGGRPVIGNNVTLGASVTIIGNVKIGNNVVIGAGSVVVHDVPNNTIVAGNPARVIRYIDMAKNLGG